MRSIDEAADNIVGQTLQGTYQVTGRIAEGGMGAVFEAVHLRLPKKRYAIKVLLPSVDKHALKRFRREAEVASELGHPHIVDVQDFNETDDGQPYMVMEYLEGEDMGRRLSRVGRMHPSEVASLARQVGAALQAAHDHNVVHRDLKPANIFLVEHPDGPIWAKVLDFGISKVIHDPGSTTTETGQNVLLGTAPYMSPEQANGLAKIDHTTDIFALGTICHQALSGELPFDDDSIPRVLYRIRYEEPPPLAGRVEGLRPEVDEVLARAMAKDRSDRYRRIADLAEQLARTLESTVGVWPASRAPEENAPETPARGGTGVGDVAPSTSQEASDAVALERGGTIRLEVPVDEPASVPPASAPTTDTVTSDIDRPRPRTALLVLGVVVAVALGIGVLTVGVLRLDASRTAPDAVVRSDAGGPGK